RCGWSRATTRPASASKPRSRNCFRSERRRGSILLPPPPNQLLSTRPSLTAFRHPPDPTMQSIRHLAAAAALAGSALSQVNPFLFYPQDPERQTVTCTSFVGRPDMSARAEALMELNTQHFRGVGDANGIVRLFGVYHWLADKRLPPTEPKATSVPPAAAGRGPDMSTAAELIRISGLTSPPSASTARGTW